MTEPRKSLLEFPCSFPIKVIGKDTAGFEGHVRSIVARHVDESATESVETRPSGAGTYLAVTVTFTARSQEQIDALYRELTADPRVLVVL
jgi:hypothetical protein